MKCLIALHYALSANKLIPKERFPLRDHPSSLHVGGVLENRIFYYQNFHENYNAKSRSQSRGDGMGLNIDS